MKKLLVLLPALLLLSGCFGGTSKVEILPPHDGQVTADGLPVTANIRSFNRGMYLFNWLPIWSGRPDLPNQRRYRTFRNYVKEGYNVIMMEQAVSKRVKSAELRDIHSEYHTSGMWSLWILWNRTLKTSAAAVKIPAGK